MNIRPLRSYSTSKASVSSNGSVESSLNSPSSSFSRLGSMVNPNEDFKEDQVCNICKKKFTFTFRRHHCRTCKESVCDDDSIIRYVREGKQKKLRICEKCDKACMKEELKLEIDNEIKYLSEQIRISTELYDSLHNQKIERTTKIHNLENKLSQTERELKRKQEDLENRLKDETDLNIKAKAKIQDFMSKLEDKQACEQEISTKISEESAKLLKLKSEKIEIDSKKTELEKKLSKLESDMKDRYVIEDIKNTVCPQCVSKLAVFEKPQMSKAKNKK
jgi:DNA repair exonuclease SbcCD ATPase subunit